MSLRSKYLLFARIISVFVSIAAMGYFALNLISVDQLNEIGRNLGFGDLFQTSDNSEIHSLDLVTPNVLSSRDLTSYNADDRAIFLNFYEPLVRLDKNLRPESALAVSWGRLDDWTWEFRMRPGVHFHNGDLLEVEDALASLNHARTYFDSGLKALLANIKDVRISENGNLLVQTVTPDPLLLNKLSLVWVYDRDDEPFLGKAAGSGPYKVLELDDNYLNLEVFDDYWDELPDFKRVSIFFNDDESERSEGFFADRYDFAIGLAPMNVTLAKERGNSVVAQSNLQVNFLLFNFKSAFLVNPQMRRAVAQILDRGEFVKLAGGFAREAQQFAGNGVFGFKSNFSGIAQNFSVGRDAILRIAGFERPILNLHLQKGLENIGQIILNQMKQAGVDVRAKYLDAEDFDKSLQNGDADMYFLGWRYELGDTADFLQSIVHSRRFQEGYGLFNGLNYQNSEVDKLIESGLANLDVSKRREQLSEVMNLIVNEDVIGVPLFETEVVYAFKKNIQLEPRIDGYLYLKDLKLK